MTKRHLTMCLAALCGLLMPAGQCLGAGGGLQAGSQLPNLLLEAKIRNLPVQAEAPRSGWIVYIFSPASAASQKNAASAEQLASSLPSDWAFLSVADEDAGVPGFLEKFHLTSPVLFQISKPTLALYAASKTPRTYVLDKDWKLLEVLDGPFQGAVAKKLSTRLKIDVTQAGAKSSPSAPAATGRQSGLSASNLCLDRQQRTYSSGARANALGFKFVCAVTGGAWRASS